MTDSASKPAPNAPPLYLHILYQTAGLAFFSVAIVPILLFRALLHIFPSARPHPSWSLRRDLAVRGGRLYLACTTYFSLPRPLGEKAWKADPKVYKWTGKGTKVKMVTVPPVGQDWITGVAEVAQGIVKPEPVACFWTFCPNTAIKEGDEMAHPSERVILYFAGGSWVMGHPQSTMFPYKFAQVTGHRVFACNHRKALSERSAMPAQLLDIAASYSYLLSHGFAAENITLIGDSSGGHLVLALSRYLAELHVDLPGGMLLISPSCDLGHPPHGLSSTDYLVPYLNARAIPSLVRHYPTTATSDNPYFSPAACGSFTYLARAQKERGMRVWIQYGSVENLREDIDRLVQRMRADGVDVDVDLVEGGVHLDAGIAYALRERGPTSSWTRLLEAVKMYA